MLITFKTVVVWARLPLVGCQWGSGVVFWMALTLKGPSVILPLLSRTCSRYYTLKGVVNRVGRLIPQP